MPAVVPRTVPAVLSQARELVVVAVVYYAAARLGLLLAFQNTNASPVWPPSGIAVTVVFLRGYRTCPGITAGAFLANVVVFTANNAANPATIGVVSLAIALGNTLEAACGAFLLRTLIAARSPFDRSRDVFLFVAAGMAACLTSSFLGTMSLCIGGIVAQSLATTVWFTWWLGDFSGVLIVMPLALTWWQSSLHAWQPARRAEVIVFLLLLLATGQVVFGDGLAGEVIPAALAFLLLPYLVWAAFRFDQRGVATAAFLVAAGAVWGTIHNRGPFVRAVMNDSVLLLQAFLGISTTTGLILAAVLTERRQSGEALHAAHSALKRHAAQLEAANKELEAFAYSVSHDLRAPLRSIDGFSQALLEDYAARLDSEGKETLQRVRSAAQRMAQLIDDLLTLSRVTRGELRRESVDLTALARMLLHELQQRDPERVVECVIAAGLTAEGDPRLLRVVLENLLANAWKFTSRQPRARIEIGILTEAGQGIYFVQDNGVGFDVAFAGKLFGAFQRLHTVHEFPGTGIGLATVERIIHRHGGRVWGEGQVGKGATFFFTL